MRAWNAPCHSAFVSVLAVLLLASGCSSDATSSPVIARVGDATLTLEDLQTYVPPGVLERATRNDLLAYANQWIRSELLYQAALGTGYEKDARVKQRVEEATRDIIVDIFLQDELDMGSFISEEEIRDYHANNQDAFRRDEDEVLASILWFADEEQASRARSELASGAAFETLAADTSFRVTAAALEGRYVGRLELGGGLAGALFGLAPGTISAVIRLEGEPVVARVEDRQEAGTVRALWEVRDDIEAHLASDLREAKLETMLSQLLAGAEVTVDVDGVLSALHNPLMP
jgi:parvulin-like peptidyl-prolyl isomerase